MMRARSSLLHCLVSLVCLMGLGDSLCYSIGLHACILAGWMFSLVPFALELSWMIPTYRLNRSFASSLLKLYQGRAFIADTFLGFLFGVGDGSSVLLCSLNPNNWSQESVLGMGQELSVCLWLAGAGGLV